MIRIKLKNLFLNDVKSEQQNLYFIVFFCGIDVTSVAWFCMKQGEEIEYLFRKGMEIERQEKEHFIQKVDCNRKTRNIIFR